MCYEFGALEPIVLVISVRCTQMRSPPSLLLAILTSCADFCGSAYAHDVCRQHA
jgi:hypothetical protein